MYQVNVIQKVEQLKDCPVFHMDHYQWTKEYRPEAFGLMALLENYGLVISMTAREKDPLTRYTENEDPVYKDSGMEAFLNFKPASTKEYFNFEMNSNGALLSGFGVKPNRKRVCQITSSHALCEAKIEEASWSVLLRVPMELICELYQIAPLKKGDHFTCNFYKISEDPSIEHYASYSPIVSEKPNFHLPEFFGDAVIV